MDYEMDYLTMRQVIDCWEKLRRVEDYEKVAGTILFQRLFEKCPPAKVLFGFPIDMDVNSETMLKSKRFLRHAAHLIEMLGRAISLLGPDIETLNEILADLGKKHAIYGVKEEHFVFMGVALQETLQITLKERFTAQDREAFSKIYDALSREMCKSMSMEKILMGKAVKSTKKSTNTRSRVHVVGSALRRTG